MKRLRLVTSVMHAYGHQWSCQLVYNPQMQVGTGLTDREGVERLWSRLRKLIGITHSSGVCHQQSLPLRSLTYWMHSDSAGYGSSTDKDKLSHQSSVTISVTGYVKDANSVHPNKKRPRALLIKAMCQFRNFATSGDFNGNHSCLFEHVSKPPECKTTSHLMISRCTDAAKT